MNSQKSRYNIRLWFWTNMYFLLVVFVFSTAWAQHPLVLELPSSLNPVGSGARALGMGGAFISVADDATAASWNPGGLVQLEKPEMSVVLGSLWRSEDKHFENHPEASGEDEVSELSLNYLSVAYPFDLAERNMVVSLNYQNLYEFNRDWSYSYNYPATSIYSGPAQFEYEQQGALYALGLAYSADITTNFSAGLTINYWGDFIYENSWEQKYDTNAKFNLSGLQIDYTNHKTEEYVFEGWNAVIGFLYRINEQLTLGGVFKSPFTADIQHTVSENEETVFTTNRIETYSASNQQDAELNMPMSYGIGLAYRFSDSFTIAGDIYRTHWDDFTLERDQGIETSPISGKNIDESDVDPTTWFRLGTEYLIITEQFVFPVRGGIFYDPAPADGSPDDYFGFSLGGGIGYQRYIFDIAYQFRRGNDVNASMWQGENLPIDVTEHKLYCSLIMYF